MLKAFVWIESSDKSLFFQTFLHAQHFLSYHLIWMSNKVSFKLRWIFDEICTVYMDSSDKSVFFPDIFYMRNIIWITIMSNIVSFQLHCIFDEICTVYIKSSDKSDFYQAFLHAQHFLSNHLIWVKYSIFISVEFLTKFVFFIWIAVTNLFFSRHLLHAQHNLNYHHE